MSSALRCTHTTLGTSFFLGQAAAVSWGQTLAVPLRQPFAIPRRQTATTPVLF
jgi:hypothetical protein